MRKVVLCVLVLALCTTAFVAAADAPTAIAVKAERPVTIDGVLDAEWEKALEHVVMITKDDPIVKDHGKVWNEDTFSAEGKFYFMWDETYLYVYAEIKDDVIFDSDPGTWLNDTVAIFAVDPETGANFKIPIPVTTASRRVLIERMNVNNSGRVPVRNLVKEKAKLTDTGWCIELAVDWQKGFAADVEIAAGKTLRFTPLLIDGRGPGGPKQNWGQAMWVGDGDYTDGSGYGWLQLSE